VATRGTTLISGGGNTYWVWLGRSYRCPLLDLFLFAQETVNLSLQLFGTGLPAIRNRFFVLYKTVDISNPGPVLPELVRSCVHPFSHLLPRMLSVGLSNGQEKSRVPFLAVPG
jgi:hypothetical protein